MALDLNAFDRMRRERGLRLVLADNAAGVVTVDDDPDAAIAELLRLARIGQSAEEVALELPDTPVSRVVRLAQRVADAAEAAAVFAAEQRQDLPA